MFKNQRTAYLIILLTLSLKRGIIRAYKINSKGDFMEKLKQPPFAGLKSAEQALDTYRQIYLELEAGDRIKLSRFNNFEADWRQVEEEKTFEAFYDLGDKKMLRYTCQLEAQDEVKALLDKIEQVEFSAEYTQKLMAQTVEILAVDIFEK